MAIIITDGEYFIKHINNGIQMTKEIEEATVFNKKYTAKEIIKASPHMLKDFYVYDTNTQQKLWRIMTEEELKKYRAEKKAKQEIKRNASGKIQRKTFSPDVKKLLYMQSDGRCALCGRKLLFEDATLDHILPLGQGGSDSVENLQICCREDNLFKGAIKPEEFVDRINKIFMYQMEKKYSGKWIWNFTKKILNALI